MWVLPVIVYMLVLLYVGEALWDLGKTAP